MSKKILITGGAGYIGSVLCNDLLMEDYKVTCIDNLMFGGKGIEGLKKNANFKFINADINNKIELVSILNFEKYDIVLHLAAIVGDPACKLYTELAIQTNWETTRWLIDKCYEIKIPRFIFASTCSNYGKMSDTNKYVDENSELAPVSLYAELKVKVEKYILEEINQDEKFSPTCLRFSTVYGLSPRMRFDLTVNEFVKELCLGRSLEVYGEQFWRPYCHVKDFAKAYMCVMNAPINQVAYNVFNVGSTNENYTKKMIIDEIKNSLPDININYVNQIDDPRDYRVNSDKIKIELGYKAEKTLKDGINEIKDAILQKKIINPDDQIYYNIPYNKK